MTHPAICRLAATLLVLLAPALGAQATDLQAEYRQRRATFAAGVGDGVVLVLGAREPEKDYLSFFQSPSFHYLTGFREPNSALVMVSRGGTVEATMFVPPRSPANEVWTGARAGVDEVARRTGMAARSNVALIPTLDTLLRAMPRLLLVTDPSESPRPTWFRTVEQLFVDTLRARVPGVTVTDLTQRLQRQRGTKSATELAYLRQAILITGRAHEEMMRALEPGMNEFELQALIEYTFRRNGADREGFASIVGSGPNATTLHYNANDRFIQDGETVVTDIGASYRGYSADITRTLPANGRFSPDQRAIYTIVRDAQAAAERQLKVGARAADMVDSSNAVIAAGLARLGLTEGPDATYECGQGQRCAQYRLFYMHGLSHGIGLEVHDPEAYYFSGVITANTAFTIEPGIYVRANLLDDVIPNTPANAAYRAKLASLLPRYRNIGVRIEDDYFITERGVEWVSRVPREIDEIERIMRAPYNGPARRDPALVDAYRRDVP